MVSHEYRLFCVRQISGNLPYTETACGNNSNLQSHMKQHISSGTVTNAEKDKEGIVEKYRTSVLWCVNKSLVIQSSSQKIWRYTQIKG